MPLVFVWERRGVHQTIGKSTRSLQQLAIVNPHLESVPINLLIQVPGTPLHGLPEFEPLELVRTIAAARIVMPESTIRLSAGRSSMSEATHALCLHAGASSIFLGDRLPTTHNSGDDADALILDQLDISVRPSISGSPLNPESSRPMFTQGDRRRCWRAP